MRVLDELRTVWRRDPAALALPLLLFAVALFVFTRALGWGLPNGDDTWATDAIKPSAPLAVVYHNFAAEGWNSGWFWFKYPPLHAFLLAAAYAPCLAWTWASGGLHGFHSDYPFGLADPEHVLARLAWIGRLLSASMGAGVVVLVYASMVRSFGRLRATAAALATAFCYPMVFYSQTTNVEVPYLFWMMVAVFAAVRLLEGEDKMRWWALLGIGAALSLSTKELVAGVLVGLPPALVGVYLAQRRPVSSWLLGGMAAALAFAAAMIVANNIAFNPRGFTNRVGFLTQTLPPEIALKYAPYYFPIDLGASRGAGAELAQLKLAATRVLESLGWPTLVLAAAGIVSALRKRPAWTLLLLSVALAYYVVSVRAMLSLSLRYVLPLSIVGMMFAGVSLGDLLESGPGSVWRRALASIFAVFVIVYGYDVNHMMRGDGRYRAEQWINQQAGDSARIEVYQNRTYLPRFPSRVAVDDIAFQERTSEAFRGRSPDLVVLSSAGLSGVSVQYKQDWHESEESDGESEQGLVEGKKSATGVVMSYQRRDNVDFLKALADGSLGYVEAARFGVDPWIPRTLIQSLNPEIVIYRRAAATTHPQAQP